MPARLLLLLLRGCVWLEGKDGWDRTIPVFQDGMIQFSVWLDGWDELVLYLVGVIKVDRMRQFSVWLVG